MSESLLCPLCGSALEPGIITLHRSAYRRCSGCRSHRRETAEVSRLHSIEYSDRYGSRKEVREAARGRRPLWPLLLDRIEADLGEGGRGRNPPRRLLDVGCGFGDFALLARERGWEVEGVEINPTMREACLAKGLNVRPTPIRELPFNGHAYNVITYLNVLDSLKTPTEELATVRRFLIEGGKIWIRVPNGALHGPLLRGFSRVRTLSEWWVRWGFSPLNEWLFTPEGLCQALRTAGFDQVEVIPAGVPHQGLPLRILERALRSVGAVRGGQVWSSSLLASARRPREDFV
ncbi:MAG: hypothetical protein GHCLOJNM_03912 [bacterium]|nr:hypothetical protein [bacterium]